MVTSDENQIYNLQSTVSLASCGLYCSDEDEFEDMSAKRQRHHFRKEQAKADQATHIAIGIEPLGSVCTDSRGIETSLPRLIKQRCI